MFTGGGFHPYLGKIPILTNSFQLGWNHQLVTVYPFMFRVRCFQPSWEVFAAKSDLDEELTVVKSEAHGGNPSLNPSKIQNH